MCDVGDRDAMLRGLHLIHAHDQSRLRVLDVPVGVDDSCGVLEDRLDLLRHLSLAGKVRAINLCYQSLNNRRPGRHFADLDARAVLVADGVQQRAKPLCNRVALLSALLRGQQVHLNVGLVRLAAHVVVADQSVEVIRARSSGVGLIVQDIRLPCKLAAQRLRHSRGLLERRAVGHVDDDLQFALVVERQHLHADQPQRNQCHRRQKQQDHARQ